MSKNAPPYLVELKFSLVAVYSASLAPFVARPGFFHDSPALFVSPRYHWYLQVPDVSLWRGSSRGRLQDG